MLHPPAIMEYPTPDTNKGTRCMSYSGTHAQRQEKYNKYRERNKENIKKSKAEYDTRTRQQRQDYINKLKSKPCIDCGESFVPDLMHFHHTRGIKSFSISQASGRSDSNLKAELAKCDLLCIYCHRRRHQQETR